MRTVAFILAILCLLILFATAYVFDVTASAEIHDGSIGRIQIPSINADFDLVWTASECNAHQHIALLYKRQGVQNVGNHYASMGTWKLENVTVGDKAYLEYIQTNGCKAEKHEETYVCYAVMICDVKDAVLSHNGREIVFDPTDLVCCTCVWSDSTRNYVAVFERVG